MSPRLLAEKLTGLGDFRIGGGAPLPDIPSLLLLLVQAELPTTVVRFLCSEVGQVARV